MGNNVKEKLIIHKSWVDKLNKKVGIRVSEEQVLVDFVTVRYLHICFDKYRVECTPYTKTKEAFTKGMNLIHEKGLEAEIESLLLLNVPYSSIFEFVNQQSKKKE